MLFFNMKKFASQLFHSPVWSEIVSRLKGEILAEFPVWFKNQIRGTEVKQEIFTLLNEELRDQISDQTEMANIKIQSEFQPLLAAQTKLVEKLEVHKVEISAQIEQSLQQVKEEVRAEKNQTIEDNFCSVQQKIMDLVRDGETVALPQIHQQVGMGETVSRSTVTAKISGMICSDLIQRVGRGRYRIR